jgi:lipoprotein NlpD
MLPEIMKTMTARLSLLLLCWLYGCAEMPARAPIDDRTAPRDNKLSAQQAPQPPDPPGYYTVKRGDTLNRIAQQFKSSSRDLTDWNRLSNPNDIRVGQQLRVQPPEDGNVGSVPTDTGLEMRALEPAASPAQAAAPAPEQAQPRVAGGLKTGPMGRKVAYTDQIWSEMQRVDPARSLDDARKPSETPSAGRFIWPTEGKVVRGFDATRKGIDIAGQAGQPIMAVGDGTVLYANSMRGYGNLVIVDHKEGVVSAYAHNKTILVKEGQTVTRGQRIAEMGDSDAESVRLHFEIRQLGKPVDPISYLPSR